MTAVDTSSSRPASQVVALSVGLAALGVALSPVQIPIGPIRAYPFQAMVNVLAGVLVGPVYGVLVAVVISILRNAIGTGTFFALPGSIFGVFLVGYWYHYIRKTDHAAWLEIVGTVFIGATVAYYLAVGLAGPTLVAGFMRLGPFKQFAIPGVVSVPGLLGLWLAFAIGSVPGAVIGYVILKAVRRAGMVAS
ncbi:MAG: energy coupling factor transporter S component ThiW [Chloroflexota bacterium]|nr:energy coupling factor transporter S component ThiW [Chloroflexota bacterium]